MEGEYRSFFSLYMCSLLSGYVVLQNENLHGIPVLVNLIVSISKNPTIGKPTPY